MMKFKVEKVLVIENGKLRPNLKISTYGAESSIISI